MEHLSTFLLNREDAVAVKLLCTILEKVDPEALLHGLAVAETARLLARHHPEVSEAEVWLAGLLHDLGLIGVPSEIIQRKGKPDRRTRAYLERHTTLGQYMVSRFFQGGDLGRIVRAHHEAFDGSGYPDGLTGEKIPLAARLIAVADYFDTAVSAGWLFSKRSPETVLGEIKAARGTKFDPEVVDLMMRLSSDVLVVHRDARAHTPEDLLAAL